MQEPVEEGDEAKAIRWAKDEGFERKYTKEGKNPIGRETEAQQELTLTSCAPSPPPSSSLPLSLPPLMDWPVG